MGEPFCYVAERDGRLYGVAVADLRDSFYSDFAGYAIRPLPTREAWEEYSRITPWGDSERANQ